MVRQVNDDQKDPFQTQDCLNEQDPLTWFGIWTPSCLKKAQTEFKLALNLYIQAANQTHELQTKCKHIRDQHLLQEPSN
jgi:hypothetical protein